MITVSQANELIQNSDRKVHKHQRYYDTDDIVQLMIWGNKRVKKDLEEFSELITPDEAGMRQLFYFLAKNIRYKADGKEQQHVKSPAKLWADRKGDCKSFTLFITSVLQNLGIPYIMRFTSYKWWNSTVKHVYPIAIINKKEIPLDVVYYLQEGGAFGTEKKFYHKIDHKMKGLAFLSGTIGDVGSGKEFLQLLREIDNSIPDSILENDLTKMSEGQLQRHLMAERMDIVAAQQSSYDQFQKVKFAAQVLRSGNMHHIGSVDSKLQSPVLKFIRETRHLTEPAFEAPIIRLQISDDEIRGFFKNVGKAIKRVGKGIVDFAKKAWSKLANWIFKGPIQKAGPFFLFTFLKKNTGRSEVERRRNKQKHVLKFFRKVGMKSKNIEAAIKNGIIKEMGATPDQVLNDAANAPVATNEINGVVAVISTAIGWLIKIIDKVTNLFKKKKDQEGVDIGNEDASDLSLLEKFGDVVNTSVNAFRDLRGKIPRNDNTGVYYSPQYQNEFSQRSTSGGGGSGGLIAAGLAALLLLN